MAKKRNNTLNELGVKERINLSCLELNEGQIVGIPKNPRYLKGEEHDKLKKSLKDSPELLQYKPLMVYAIEGGKFVVICGNMRLRICQELHNEGVEGFDALPCFVLNKDVPIAKIKEYAIKDNVQAGNWDWDELANGDWEVEDLQDWGVDCSFLQKDEWEELPPVDEEVKDPVLDKPIKIEVTIPLTNKEQEDEIREAIKVALTDYPVEIK
nr:MAG TPA: ParB protein [Caudoviricetes sp.]